MSDSVQQGQSISLDNTAGHSGKVGFVSLGCPKDS